MVKERPCCLPLSEFDRLCYDLKESYQQFDFKDKVSKMPINLRQKNSALAEMLGRAAEEIALEEFGKSTRALVTLIEKEEYVPFNFRRRVSTILNFYGQLTSLSKDDTERVAIIDRQLALKAKLGAMFSADKVEHTFIKGSALSKLLYGSPRARISSDIDILISQASGRKAHTILGGLGYKQELLYLRNGLQREQPTDPVLKASGRLHANYKTADSVVELQYGVDLYGRHGLGYRSISADELNGLDRDVHSDLRLILTFICDKHKDLIAGWQFSLRCLIDLLACLRHVREQSLKDSLFRLAERENVVDEVREVLGVLKNSFEMPGYDGVSFQDQPPSVLSNYDVSVFSITEYFLLRQYCLSLQSQSALMWATSVAFKDTYFKYDSQRSDIEAEGRYGIDEVVVRIGNVSAGTSFVELELDGFHCSDDQGDAWSARLVLPLSDLEDRSAEVFGVSGSIACKIENTSNDDFLVRISSVRANFKWLAIKRMRVNTGYHFSSSLQDHTRLTVIDEFPLPREMRYG